jgi:hypothetical protein
LRVKVCTALTMVGRVQRRDSLKELGEPADSVLEQLL